jgi:hypothetical protein
VFRDPGAVEIERIETRLSAVFSDRADRLVRDH